MIFFSLCHEIRQNEGLKPNPLFGLPVKVFQSEPSEICVTHNPHGFCFLKGNIFVVGIVGTITVCLSPFPTFLGFSQMLPNMGYSGGKKPAGLPSSSINVTLTKPEHVFLQWNKCYIDLLCFHFLTSFLPLNTIYLGISQKCQVFKGV